MTLYALLHITRIEGHILNNMTAARTCKVPSDYQNEVTTVICRKIKPGHEKDYNDWVRRYLTFEKGSWLPWYYNNRPWG